MREFFVKIWEWIKAVPANVWDWFKDNYKKGAGFYAFFLGVVAVGVNMVFSLRFAAAFIVIIGCAIGAHYVVKHCRS